MPQVDLETLVSALSNVSCDNKVACETLSDTDPPDSFFLSKDAELDWFDHNAFFYDRKDSTKGNSSSLDPTRNPNPVSNSQRFAHIKSKPSIFGLPKNQKAAYAEARSRRSSAKPCSARLFPKRSVSTGKPVESSLVEPSSPKVSCMGRVRSRRDRNRRLRYRQKSKRSTDSNAKNIKETKKGTISNGFSEIFRAVFRSKKPAKGNNESSQAARVRAGDIRDRLPESEMDTPERWSVEGEPVGLGGMRRFVSGRRSIESIGVDVA